MSSRPPDNLIGKQLGPFEILDEIGRGGMATVYRARQPSINRIVAVKVLPRHFLHDPDFLERFKREVDVISHLEHPHILPIYDYGEADGVPFIAMRYLAGGSLAQLVRRGVSSLETLERPLMQVAQALDYAHKQGIIHRDLKPGNILLDENDNAYLTDFGIARVLNSTMTGSAIIGTPAYISPEQANGLPLDGRSDIYSLGVVLYELITGREPYEAQTPMGLLLKHINEPMPSVRLLRPEVSPAVEEVIYVATAKSPQDRYASATQMATAYRQAVHTTEGEATMLLSGAGTPTPTPAPTGGRAGRTAPHSTAPGRTGETPTSRLPADAVPAAPASGRRFPLGVVMGLAALVIGALALATLVLPRIAPAVPTLPPPPTMTPFAGSRLFREAAFSMAAPRDWDYRDLSDDERLLHRWQSENRDAVVTLALYSDALAGGAEIDAVRDEYDQMLLTYDDEVVPVMAMGDETAAPDGSLRQSWQVIPGQDSPLEPGQWDVFWMRRGDALVILQFYSAYSAGNDIVPVFQDMLDSLRVTATES